MSKTLLFLTLVSTLFCLTNCKNKQSEVQTITKVFEKGTFGYDASIVKKYFPDSFVLSNGENQILISPELQGRVMTSSLDGNKGASFGWINHHYIESGERNSQFNPFGGEERFWVGPEGGQFSIYFEPGSSFDFENWKVPNVIDTEAFDLIRKTKSEAYFQKETQFINYSNKHFQFKIDRAISILNNTKAAQILNVDIPADIDMVGFESKNSITNMGNVDWDKEYGMLSIWILSMFKPSENTVVVVPFKTGDEHTLGKIVTDDYFGKIPSDRLKVADSVLFFKTDGKKRSKIGLSPKRSLPIMGSYDPDNNVLTIAQFTLEENQFDYVNSLWKIQENPFSGDAINSYNDGPLENGDQLGPFYELESSSRAANLSPNETLTHYHRTFHFVGDVGQLNALSINLLHSSLNKIKNAF